MAEEVTEVVETTETEIDEAVENTEEVEETTEETNQEEEQQKEETEEFNPDELDLETDDLYKIGGYDLTKYKDRIDLTNDTIRSNFENMAKELTDLGFQQNQIEYLLDKEFGNLNQETERTSEEIKKELSEVLSPQEKRNYKAVGGYVKDLLKDDPKMQTAYKEIMGNPYIVKLLNKAYTHSLNGKDINSFKEQKEITEKPLFDTEDVRFKIKEYVRNNERIDKEDFRKNLKSWIKNSKNPSETMNEFKSYFI